jgi:hypothetical protein
MDTVLIHSKVTDLCPLPKTNSNNQTRTILLLVVTSFVVFAASVVWGTSNPLLVEFGRHVDFSSQYSHVQMVGSNVCGGCKERLNFEVCIILSLFFRNYNSWCVFKVSKARQCFADLNFLIPFLSIIALPTRCQWLPIYLRVYDGNGSNRYGSDGDGVT